MLALTALEATVGCASNAVQCESFDQVESAIRVEVPDAAIDPVPASGAILAVYAAVADGSEPRFACTATRIGDGSFITARHCLPAYVSPGPGAEAQPKLLIGTPPRSDRSSCAHESALVAVTSIVAHAELDLALLETEPVIGLPPPVMALAADAPKPGEPAFIAGYGLNEVGTPESLRSLGALVIEVNDSEITVQGSGGGACVGDSGGPLFTQGDTGEATLFGVLSKGSASCLGRDVYIDVSYVHAWAAPRELSERPPAPRDALIVRRKGTGFRP